jgi:hypothetical protein
MVTGKHTEMAMVEGQMAEIGRDPRQMSVAELEALGHHKRRLLDAIRENCIGCCAGSPAEVRRCRADNCPMWPYRMGTNPFTSVTLSEADRAKRRERMATLRKTG